MPSDPPTSAAHRWVHRASFGQDWWACECGAMSVDDIHPDQSGKLARPGTGKHAYEGKHRAPSKSGYLQFDQGNPGGKPL